MEKTNLILNSAIEIKDNNELEGNGKGRLFISKFIEPGIAHYEQFGDVLITKETLDKFIQSMVGCPVIIKHKDITDENVDKERVGVVSKVWYSEFDGWYWCEGILWDKQAIDLVKNQGWSVSCTYDFESDKQEKTHNGKKIDMEFTGGEFLHLALVDNPRYERANIVVNSRDSVENDKWITIKPHGDESDDYRRLKLEDGESPKEAIDRVYKKEDKEEYKESSEKFDIKTYTENKPIYIKSSKGNLLSAIKKDGDWYAQGNKINRESDIEYLNKELDKAYKENKKTYERILEDTKSEEGLWDSGNLSISEKDILDSLLKDGTITRQAGEEGKHDTANGTARWVYHYKKDGETLKETYYEPDMEEHYTPAYEENIQKDYEEFMKAQKEKKEQPKEDKKELSEDKSIDKYLTDKSDKGWLYETKGTSTYSNNGKSAEVEEYGKDDSRYRVVFYDGGRRKDIKVYGTKRGMEKAVSEHLQGGLNKEQKALSTKTSLEDAQAKYKDVLSKYNEADRKRWQQGISTQDYYKAWDDYNKYKKELTTARREYAESIMSNFEAQEHTAYDDKIADKKMRYEEMAAKTDAESKRMAQVSRDMISAIPMGQPILVGHHSEMRDRRYRQRAWDKMDKAYQLSKKADYYADKAGSVGTAGISADDANAIAKLAQKYQSGVDSAEKRRIIDRVIDLHSRATSTKPASEQTDYGFSIKRNKDINRLQLKFDDIPDANTRAVLKSNGFRWSPKEKAWQRQLGDNSERSLKYVMEKMKAENALLESIEDVLTEHNISNDDLPILIGLYNILKD